MHKLHSEQISRLRTYLKIRLTSEFKKETIDENLVDLNLYDMTRIMQIYKGGYPTPLGMWQRI